MMPPGRARCLRATPLFTEVRGRGILGNSRYQDPGRSLSFRTPRAAHGYLLGLEGSMVVTHEARMRYERLRLATPGRFLCKTPVSGVSVRKIPLVGCSKKSDTFGGGAKSSSPLQSAVDVITPAV